MLLLLLLLVRLVAVGLSATTVCMGSLFLLPHILLPLRLRGMGQSVPQALNLHPHVPTCCEGLEWEP